MSPAASWALVVAMWVVPPLTVLVLGRMMRRADENRADDLLPTDDVDQPIPYVPTEPREALPLAPGERAALIDDLNRLWHGVTR